MEESLTGFIRTGGWLDIVEHGERITSALIELDIDSGEYEESFSRWDSWRPKSHERLHDDVNEKTAAEAATKEGPGEEAGTSPDEDLKSAGKRLSESVDKIERGDPQAAFRKWRDTVGFTARAADSSWRKLFRPIEAFIYKHIMTKMSPYYFDTELINANITRHSRKPNQYTFEVNIADDELREKIGTRLEEYEESVDRWHVSTKSDTEAAEHVEGVDYTPDDDGETVHPERTLGQEVQDKDADE